LDFDPVQKAFVFADNHQQRARWQEFETRGRVYRVLDGRPVPYKPNGK
jgi:hypothetical protein